MRHLIVPMHLVHVSRKKLKKLHPRKVADYTAAYERGDDFPPIEVEDCGDFYTIRDARHRYIAQHNLEYAMIDVVVVRGGIDWRCAQRTPGGGEEGSSGCSARLLLRPFCF